MRRCKRCGQSIEHLGKKAKYCARSDGDGRCYRMRLNEHQTRYVERTPKENTGHCEICGVSLKGCKPNAKTCSERHEEVRVARAELERQRKVNLKERLNNYRDKIDNLVGDLYPEFPYKMPIDPSVTPSMMYPFTGVSNDKEVQ